MKKHEVERLKEIAKQLHWMARRYADGRQSYVTSMFNDLTAELLSLGVELNPCDEKTVWAKDAMGRAYDGLDDVEAIPGTPAALGEYFKKPVRKS